MTESPHISKIMHPKNVHHLIDGHTQFQHKQLESGIILVKKILLFAH